MLLRFVNHIVSCHKGGREAERREGGRKEAKSFQGKVHGLEYAESHCGWEVIKEIDLFCARCKA